MHFSKVIAALSFSTIALGAPLESRSTPADAAVAALKARNDVSAAMAASEKSVQDMKNIATTATHSLWTVSAYVQQFTVAANAAVAPLVNALAVLTADLASTPTTITQAGMYDLAGMMKDATAEAGKIQDLLQHCKSAEDGKVDPLTDSEKAAMAATVAGTMNLIKSALGPYAAPVSAFVANDPVCSSCTAGAKALVDDAVQQFKDKIAAMGL